MTDTHQRSQGPRLVAGPMSGHVIRMSGFMIMGFLAMTISGLIEVVYLGMVGRDELAAIAFTFPVTMALGAMTRGIGIGSGAVLARAMGRGDREHAATLTSHGLLMVLVFTLACAGLLAWQAEPLFSLLGARDHILELVLSYITIWCIGFPCFGLSMVGSGLMRSIGDPAYPGYMMTAGSTIQVLIGPVLIFGWFGVPALGLEGAAWAFVIARCCSFSLAAYWFLLRERIIRWRMRSFTASARAILHVGIPAMATNLIQPLSTGVTTWIIAAFGDSVVAGFGAASRIYAVVSMVIIGIASSTGPLVGQNWGAQLFDRVNEAMRLCYQYCLAWGAIAAIIMWVGGATFASLINDDPEVIATATSFLHIVPVTLGFLGMMNVANGAFNALSKPAPPLILSLLRMWVVYVPMAIIAGRLFGHAGVFAATAIANLLLGSLGWWWSRRMLEWERAKLEA
jgi:putative MATE family efflux protein